ADARLGSEFGRNDGLLLSRRCGGLSPIRGRSGRLWVDLFSGPSMGQLEMPRTDADIHAETLTPDPCAAPRILGQALERLKLGPLDLFVQAAHAAARAHGELVHGKKPRRFVEAPLEILVGLDLVAVVADQAENGRLARGDVADRIEGAGCFAVVLEEE